MFDHSNVYVFMGVCGTGKSTVARLVAKHFGKIEIEADDHHSPENTAKINAVPPIPLTDEDRWPWLLSIATEINEQRRHGPVFVTCSALRQKYRDFLRHHSAGDINLVHLHASPEVLRPRIIERRKQDANTVSVELLDSQLAALEIPTDTERPIRIDVANPPDQIVPHVISLIEASHTRRSAPPSPGFHF